MFDRGNILYIENYQLSNGNIKPKYFIVLENLAGEAIIATLPTSQQYIDQEFINKGCIKQHQTHAYYFPRGVAICENQFSFSLNTFVLFRDNIFKESLELFTTKYPENKIEIKGKLISREYSDLIYCMYKSNVLRPDIERIFESILDDIL